MLALSTDSKEVKRDVLARVAQHITSIRTSCSEESTPEVLVSAISAALDLLIASDAVKKTVSAAALVRKLLTFLVAATDAADAGELDISAIGAKITLSFPILTPLLFHADALVRSHVFYVAAALAGPYFAAAKTSDVTTQISLITRVIDTTSLGDGEALYRLAELISRVLKALPVRADDTGVIKASEQAWYPLVIAFATKIVAAPKTVEVIALPLLLALAPALTAAAAFTQANADAGNNELIALLIDYSNAVVPAVAAAATKAVAEKSTKGRAKVAGATAVRALPQPIVGLIAATLTMTEIIARSPNSAEFLVTGGALSGAVSLLALIRPAYLISAEDDNEPFSMNAVRISNSTFAFVQTLLRKTSVSTLPVMAKLGLLAACAAFLPASKGETSVLSAALWCCSMFHRDDALIVQLLLANVLPCYLSLTMHSDPIIRSVAAFSASAAAGLMLLPFKMPPVDSTISPGSASLEGSEWAEALIKARGGGFSIEDLMFVRDQVWSCFDTKAVTAIISYLVDLDCPNNLQSPVAREFRGFVSLLSTVMLAVNKSVQAEILAESKESFEAIIGCLSAASHIRKALPTGVRDTLNRMLLSQTGGSTSVFVRLPAKNGSGTVTHIISEEEFNQFWCLTEYPSKFGMNDAKSLLSSGKKKSNK